MIADAGGAVVWDDLCTGGRAFEEPIPAAETRSRGWRTAS